MAPVELKCVKVDCAWVSQSMEYDQAVQMLQIHIKLEHTTVQPEMATSPHASPQAEHVKRPSLTFTGRSLEQEDFEHFQYQFDIYKSRLGGNQDSGTLLRECLASDVSRAIFSNHGSSMKSMTEKELLDAISTCCVTKQTLQARIAELYRLKQDVGQKVQTYLATLKLKARQCEMKIKTKVKCTEPTCSKEVVYEVDYSKEIIKNLFIIGLADVELQQDIMVEEDLTLDKAVSMASARETAKRCQEGMETDQQNAALSAYKRDLLKPKLTADQCWCCGEKRHKTRSDCPAKENKCPCGLTGHYKKFCFSGGKTRVRKEKSETDEANQEEEGNTMETMFSLQAEEAPYTGRLSPNTKNKNKNERLRKRSKHLKQPMQRNVNKNSLDSKNTNLYTPIATNDMAILPRTSYARSLVNSMQNKRRENMEEKEAALPVNNTAGQRTRTTSLPASSSTANHLNWVKQSLPKSSSLNNLSQK